jgi:hypothetical protein
VNSEPGNPSKGSNLQRFACSIAWTPGLDLWLGTLGFLISAGAS